MNCSIRKNSSKIKGWTELHYHLLPGFESLSRRQNDSHCDGSGWAQSKKSSASGIQHRKMFQAFLHNEAEELRCQSFAWLREPQPTAKTILTAMARAWYSQKEFRFWNTTSQDVSGVLTQ